MNTKKKMHYKKATKLEIPAYPNAAGKKYHMGVLLDYLLTVVTCIGLTAAFLFMITVL